MRYRLLLILFLIAPFSVSAIETTRYPGVPIKNDIVLSPAKESLNLKPGDKVVKYVMVQNRMGKDAIFSVEVGDFSPSTNPDNGIVVSEGSDSSLKKYISVDSTEFLLTHGEVAKIPVTISLPKKVAGGGLYAAVLISGSAVNNEPGITKVITRLGSLFFVKVEGVVKAKQSGVMKSAVFYDDKIEIVFENNGEVYLDPRGAVNIFDSSNKLVKTIELDPWFVLPKSIRSRIVTIRDLPTGKYTASVMMNRGYNNLTDTENLSFDFVGTSNVYLKVLGVIIFVAMVSLMLLLWKKRISK